MSLPMGGHGGLVWPRLRPAGWLLALLLISPQAFAQPAPSANATELPAPSANATELPAPSANATGLPAEDPEALLARLDAQMAQSDPNGDTGALRLYGFADFAYRKQFLSPGSALSSNLYPRAAFMIGNFNLYLASELGQAWESLAEVRFTYLPNGTRTIVGDQVERVDTSVVDYIQYGNSQVSGILIERIWLQYTAHPLLTIRGGSWLTPYGIWNEDHGSPTIIPVVRPYVIGLELLPERQTGVQLRGTGYPSEALSLGYAVGLSNGRGPVHEYADLDANKALTLRLSGMHRGAGTLQFGVFSYFGRYTNLQQSAVAKGAGVGIKDEIVDQYDELSYGVDVRYTLGGFHAQAEFIVNERAYTDAGRLVRTATTFYPDDLRLGGYLVTGYRFDWMGLMPYVVLEHFSVGNVVEPTRPATTDTFRLIGSGLNSRPTHNVTLKLEVMGAYFSGDIPPGSAFADPLGTIQAQAAWAF